MPSRAWWALAVMVVGTVASVPAHAQYDDDDGYDDGYVPPPAPPEDGDAVNVPVTPEFQGGDVDDANAFYEPLAPYGQWIYIGGMGRVWRPYPSVVGYGFRPYATGGHWVYTDAGWTFASGYAWGWAPFHYGHWWYDAAYGWVWLPGTRWAPAWVDWRYGGDYVGWAPAPPPGYAFAVAAAWGSPWCFVRSRYVTSPEISTYVVPVTSVRTVYSATEVVPVTPVYGRAYSYSPGPPVARISAALGRPVQVVPVAQVGRAMPPAEFRHVAHPVVVTRPAYRGSSGRWPSGSVPVRPSSYPDQRPTVTPRPFQDQPMPTATRAYPQEPDLNQRFQPRNEARPAYNEPSYGPRPTYRPGVQAVRPAQAQPDVNQRFEPQNEGRPVYNERTYGPRPAYNPGARPAFAPQQAQRQRQRNVYRPRRVQRAAPKPAFRPRKPARRRR